MRKLVKSLFFSRAYYGCSYKEYFNFGFENLSDRERKQYVCWLELFQYYKQFNASGKPELFNDKALTYQTFRDFFKRDTAIIRDPSQKGTFLSFVNSHNTCFLKPLQDFGGSGIQRLSSPLDPKTVESSLNCCPFIIEEAIVQDPGMAEFYPNSVNTIRYTTFYHGGELMRLQAVIRMGRGGSCVDNATAGDIYALVDTETGMIVGPARSFSGEEFESHPDTGIPFAGTYVPRWNDLNDLVEKIVRVVPEQKLVGWDFALSINGWTMVEGNAYPTLQSFDLRHGLRPLVQDAFGRVIPVWRR